MAQLPFGTSTDGDLIDRIGGRGCIDRGSVEPFPGRGVRVFVEVANRFTLTTILVDATGKVQAMVVGAPCHGRLEVAVPWSLGTQEFRSSLPIRIAWCCP